MYTKYLVYGNFRVKTTIKLHFNHTYDNRFIILEMHFLIDYEHLDYSAKYMKVIVQDNSIVIYIKYISLMIFCSPELCALSSLPRKTNQLTCSLTSKHTSEASSIGRIIRDCKVFFLRFWVIFGLNKFLAIITSWNGR